MYSESISAQEPCGRRFAPQSIRPRSSPDGQWFGLTRAKFAPRLPAETGTRVWVRPSGRPELLFPQPAAPSIRFGATGQACGAPGVPGHRRPPRLSRDVASMSHGFGGQQAQPLRAGASDTINACWLTCINYRHPGRQFGLAPIVVAVELGFARKSKSGGRRGVPCVRHTLMRKSSDRPV